ncbi:hypothetical protein OHS70_35510 [Streptomyces sp. NBC_00390]
MTTEGGTRICVVCDKPVTGPAVRVPQFSASGARPDNWRHPLCIRRPK